MKMSETSKRVMAPPPPSVNSNRTGPHCESNNNASKGPPQPSSPSAAPKRIIKKIPVDFNKLKQAGLDIKIAEALRQQKLSATPTVATITTNSSNATASTSSAAAAKQQQLQQKQQQLQQQQLQLQQQRLGIVHAAPKISRQRSTNNNKYVQKVAPPRITITRPTEEARAAAERSMQIKAMIKNKILNKAAAAAAAAGETPAQQQQGITTRDLAAPSNLRVIPKADLRKKQPPLLLNLVNQLPKARSLCITRRPPVKRTPAAATVTSAPVTSAPVIEATIASSGPAPAPLIVLENKVLAPNEKIDLRALRLPGQPSTPPGATAGTKVKVIQNADKLKVSRERLAEMAKEIRSKLKAAGQQQPIKAKPQLSRSSVIKAPEPSPSTVGIISLKSITESKPAILSAVDFIAQLGADNPSNESSFMELSPEELALSASMTKSYSSPRIKAEDLAIGKIVKMQDIGILHATLDVAADRSNVLCISPNAIKRQDDSTFHCGEMENEEYPLMDIDDISNPEPPTLAITVPPVEPAKEVNNAILSKSKTAVIVAPKVKPEKEMKLNKATLPEQSTLALNSSPIKHKLESSSSSSSSAKAPKVRPENEVSKVLPPLALAAPPEDLTKEATKQASLIVAPKEEPENESSIKSSVSRGKKGKINLVPRNKKAKVAKPVVKQITPAEESKKEVIEKAEATVPANSEGTKISDKDESQQLMEDKSEKVATIEEKESVNLVEKKSPSIENRIERHSRTEITESGKSKIEKPKETIEKVAELEIVNKNLVSKSKDNNIKENAVRKMVETEKENRKVTDKESDQKIPQQEVEASTIGKQTVADNEAQSESAAAEADEKASTQEENTSQTIAAAKDGVEQETESKNAIDVNPPEELPSSKAIKPASERDLSQLYHPPKMPKHKQKKCHNNNEQVESPNVSQSPNVSLIDILSQEQASPQGEAQLPFRTQSEDEEETKLQTKLQTETKGIKNLIAHLAAEKVEPIKAQLEVPKIEEAAKTPPRKKFVKTRPVTGKRSAKKATPTDQKEVVDKPDSSLKPKSRRLMSKTNGTSRKITCSTSDDDSVDFRGFLELDEQVKVKPISIAKSCKRLQKLKSSETDISDDITPDYDDEEEEDKDLAVLAKKFKTELRARQLKANEMQHVVEETESELNANNRVKTISEKAATDAEAVLARKNPAKIDVAKSKTENGRQNAENDLEDTASAILEPEVHLTEIKAAMPEPESVLSPAFRRKRGAQPRRSVTRAQAAAAVIEDKNPLALPPPSPSALPPPSPSPSALLTPTPKKRGRQARNQTAAPAIVEPVEPVESSLPPTPTPTPKKRSRRPKNGELATESNNEETPIEPSPKRRAGNRSSIVPPATPNEPTIKIEYQPIENEAEVSTQQVVDVAEAATPKRRPGRPINKPEAANAVSDFNIRLLLITKREQLNTEEKLTEANVKSKGAVQCGLCLERTSQAKWQAHLGEHYGVGWQIGQPEPCLSRSSVLNIMGNYLKTQNSVKRFTCRLCQRQLGSGLGMLLHLEGCGEQPLRLECEFCKRNYTKLSLIAHLRTCQTRLMAAAGVGEVRQQDDEQANSNESETVYSNAGRAKRKSTIKAETKLKKIGAQLQAQNLNNANEADFEADSSDYDAGKDKESSDEDESEGVNSSEEAIRSEDDSDLADGADAGKDRNKALFRRQLNTNTSKPLYQRYRDPDTPVTQKWKEFLQFNYTKGVLYEQLLPLYSRLKPAEAQALLSARSSKSIRYAYGEKEPKWTHLNRLESDNTKNEHISYLGAPIKQLAWAPLPASVKSQYLLCALRPRMLAYTRQLAKKQPHDSLLLLLECTPGKGKNWSVQTRLHYAIRVPHCVVHTFAFLPSGGYDAANNRLGVLAVGGGTSEVKIYALPLKLEASEQQSEVDVEADMEAVIELQPVLVLSLDLERPVVDHCVKLCWSESFGHNLIAAGFVSGNIAYWDIGDDQSLNCIERQNLRHFVPVNFFYFGERNIQFLELHYDDRGPRWLAAGSSTRKMGIYDICNWSQPLPLCGEPTGNSFTSCMSWPPIWETLVFGTTEVYKKEFPRLTRLSPSGIHFNIMRMDSMLGTCRSVHYSNEHNVQVVVTDNGDVIFMNPRELNMFSSMQFRCVAMTEAHNLNDSTESKSKSEEAAAPITAGDFQRDFGLLFKPLVKLPQAKRPTYLRDRQRPSSEFLPLLRSNCVRFNGNRGTHRWVAAGYELGFVRIINFDCEKFL